jgi:hypothetical protein
MEAAICWVCRWNLEPPMGASGVCCDGKMRASKSWMPILSLSLHHGIHRVVHPRSSFCSCNAHTRQMERVVPVVAVNDDDDDTDMDMDVIHASPCWRTTMPSSFTNENNVTSPLECHLPAQANEQQLPLSFSTLHISSSLFLPPPPPPPQQHYQQQPPPPPAPHNMTRNDLLAMLERDELGVTLAVTCDDCKWHVVKRSKRVSRMRGASPLIRQ